MLGVEALETLPGLRCLKVMVPCVVIMPQPATTAHLHLWGRMWSDCKERMYLGPLSSLLGTITNKLSYQQVFLGGLKPLQSIMEGRRKGSLAYVINCKEEGIHFHWKLSMSLLSLADYLLCICIIGCSPEPSLGTGVHQKSPCAVLLGAVG